MATVIRSFPDPGYKADSEALIGELLLDGGSLREQDIGRVVVAQREQGLRFGEAALRLGLVKSTDIRRALARQFSYSYVEPGTGKFDPQLAAAYEPFSAYAESLRGLRTQLMLRWFTDGKKTLAVIAPRVGEGHSTVAANLAVVFAQLGERTLLIDANLRSPQQHKLFGLEPSEGLAQLLMGRGAVNRALLPVEPFEHLAILCAGASAPNPQELLGRTTFSYLMETLPSSFDVVIVDTPPALECADAHIIAARAGGCLLVTRRHRTRFSDLERTAQQLEPSGALVIGAVVNE